MFLSQCELKIDLPALVENWKLMQRFSGQARCAAVVKANAYGLGVEEVGRALVAAGCSTLMVASIDEVAQLRAAIPSSALEIFVLSGVFAGDEPQFEQLNAKPVICSLSMLQRWAEFSSGNFSCALKIDTGMGRLGLPFAECESVLQQLELLDAAAVDWVFSHLACADEAEHPMNRKQLEAFELWRERFLEKKSALKFSLANSSGILLGQEYCFDMVRPGISIYGGLESNGLRSVVELSLPIIQVKTVEAGSCVGYGATHCFQRPAKIVIVSGGYADGVFRSLSGRGFGSIAGVRVPMVGRVSMDTTIFDVTELKTDLVEGDLVQVLGPQVPLGEQAGHAGTIPYELLTALGQRFRRVYCD
jgi:alanine racemase